MLDVVAFVEADLDRLGQTGDGPAQEPGAATGEETVEGEFKEV